jgi:hypothetical protein
MKHYVYNKTCMGRAFSKTSVISIHWEYSTNNFNQKKWKMVELQFLREDKADIDAYRTQPFFPSTRNAKNDHIQPEGCYNPCNPLNIDVAHSYI